MELNCTTEKSEKETVKPSWRRRALKIILWLVGVPIALAVLLTIYFYIGGIEWGDWTIPNESALRLELHDVPDEENAYLALQALTNLYNVAEGDDESAEISDRAFVKFYGDLFLRDYSSDYLEKWSAIRKDPSSPERAERILADNAEFFEGLKKALSFKRFANVDAKLEYAKLAKEGKMTFVMSFLGLHDPLVRFAQLIELRSQVAIEKGDIEAAVSDIADMHALGQLLKINNEELVAYLCGALIEKFSFTKMCDVVATGNATEEIVERFSKMVDVSDANGPKAWGRALKTESARHFEGVEWYCNHPDKALFYGGTIFYDFDGDTLSPTILCRILANWPGFAKFAIHRREMLYRQAMLDRAMLAGDDDLTEMIFREIPRNPFLPNCVGNNIVSMQCPIINPIGKEGCLNRLRPRLVLASEKWRRAHGGENPPSLEALVPDYLAAVPRDPWSKSGESMKYDAALGVVWSIGKDGKCDYREIAKDLSATGNKASIYDDTQKYAFRLDGKPIGFPIKAGHR